MHCLVCCPVYGLACTLCNCLLSVDQQHPSLLVSDLAKKKSGALKDGCSGESCQQLGMRWGDPVTYSLRKSSVGFHLLRHQRITSRERMHSLLVMGENMGRAAVAVCSFSDITAAQS